MGIDLVRNWVRGTGMLWNAYAIHYDEIDQ